jgi:hypothetical protein
MNQMREEKLSKGEVNRGEESQNLRIGPNVMRRLLCGPLLK